MGGTVLLRGSLAAGSGCARRLDLARARPSERGHLAGDRRRDHLSVLARPDETPEPRAQPELRLPGDGPHRLWRSFQPGADLVRHASREAIAPGSLDQHAAGTAIAGLGDTTAL